jgi:hypothetical protein
METHTMSKVGKTSVKNSTATTKKTATATTNKPGKNAEGTQDKNKTKDTEKAKDTGKTGDSTKPDGSGKTEEADKEQDKVNISDEAKAEKGKGITDDDKMELAEMLKKWAEEKEEDAHEPNKVIEDKGGACCGRPKAPDKIEAGDVDWNKLLQADIIAVKAQQLGGGGSQAANGGQKGGPQGGAKGAAVKGGPKGATAGTQGANGAKGQDGQEQDPMGKLSMHYQMAKSAGAQLDPSVEKTVKGLLGIADTAGPGPGQGGPEGQSGRGLAGNAAGAR